MIDKTAIIDKSAQIGQGVSIGAYSVIGRDVIIKDGASIGSNCYIEFAQIGANCKIYNSVSIGTPPQDLSYNNEPSRAYIGDATTFREFVTINRGTKKTLKTIIGKNCYFMACCHAAHDTRVGDGVIMANCSSLGGHVEVGDRAFISGNVGVHQFTRIGKGTMTGSNSMVGMDIIPYAMCSGQRAVLEGLNLVGMKRAGMTLEQIREVKNAYKILFSSKLLLKDALTQLEKEPSALVAEILLFIKGSKRSIARPE
ncbi:MAG: acyl-ACP--UDP-N-acetylglucosamine O-acyltransferase [Elusimicrobiota bacterium]|jgi:UDP-N-acetylglucosamine acyltransferase|nr:acyl-ACP--UDP-N-acetylglucosamine O-acyltransferase [Elusimicrobiota bacterium]